MSDTPSDAAARIRREREIRGWTQDQLAKYANVSRNTVSRIETGRDYRDPRSLAKVEAVLFPAGDPSGDTPSDDAARIRREREIRGWTRIDLAERAGVSPTTVSRIETGRRRSSQLVARIEAALHEEPWAEILDRAPASEFAAALLRRLGAAQQAAEAVPDGVFGEAGTLLPPRQGNAPLAGNG